MNALIRGTILGGLIAFLSSFVSWEFLLWHEKITVAFQNETEVSAIIAAKDGNYLLPDGRSTGSMTPDQRKPARLAYSQKV